MARVNQGPTEWHPNPEAAHPDPLHDSPAAATKSEYGCYLVLSRCVSLRGKANFAWYDSLWGRGVKEAFPLDLVRIVSGPRILPTIHQSTNNPCHCLSFQFQEPTVGVVIPEMSANGRMHDYFTVRSHPLVIVECGQLITMMPLLNYQCQL